MNRYSAKLLFQFRVEVNGDSGKRRLCEERIILLRERSSKAALNSAKRKGRLSQFHYENCEGHMVYFEFVGVMDFLYLGPECEDDEVWYDIHERLLPMERKLEMIPAERDLLENLDSSTGRTHPMAIARTEKYKPGSLDGRKSR